MPIAFCHAVLSNRVNFPVTYLSASYSNDEKVTLRFADEIMYRVAFEHATSLLKSGKSPNDLLPVFGRSAEYAVINRLLEKGGSLDGIRMVEPVLFGYED